MSKNVTKHTKYGYWKLDPVPTQEEVDEFYSKEFYDANAKYFNNSALQVQLQQSEYNNSRWQDIYERASEFFGDDLKEKEVFDIGFGFAQALLYLKEKGLKTFGLEPSIEGVEYARDNGIEAFQAGIENFDIVEGRRFDMVMIMNVLEHLRDPEQTLLDIKDKLVKKDGLVVIEVPNDFNALQKVANKEFDLDEWWVLSPNHINYFSHDTLEKLCEGCGYKIVHKTASFPLELFLLFGDVYIGDAELGSKCHEKRVNFEKLMRKHGMKPEMDNLYSAFANLNLGRTVLIYATPI
jgi:SAM-dependent methyltransferase